MSVTGSFLCLWRTENDKTICKTTAQGVINLHNNRSNSLDIEDLWHIERVIQHIESRGKIPCPRPRKTYELKAIAKWMTEITGIKYLPEHIMENLK